MISSCAHLRSQDLLCRISRSYFGLDKDGVECGCGYNVASWKLDKRDEKSLEVMKDHMGFQWKTYNGKNQLSELCNG